MKVKFMLYPLDKWKNFFIFFIGIGNLLSKLFPYLKYDLKIANIKTDEKYYLTVAFFSALTYGFFIFTLTFILFYLKYMIILSTNVYYSLTIGIVFFIMFFILHVFYPKIQAQNLAKSVDRDLIFALKGMSVMISSGISLFQAMNHIAKAKYGNVSKEFKEIVNDINSGISEIKALEAAALRTKSEYFRKTIWQLITSLKSGASLSGALRTIIAILVNYQRRVIKDFAAELNLWILIYLLFAAAVPTLGIVMLVIFSTLSGSAVGKTHLFVLITMSFAIQIALIGFVKTRVPKVYV